MANRTGGGRDHPIRDQALLDALDQLPQKPFAGDVWRSVGAGRDPLSCWRSGGRWDDGSFDVLYTSLSRDVAWAERRFHLYAGQPIPPSKRQYEMFALSVSLEAVIEFSSPDGLAALGMDVSRFGQLSYTEREAEYPRSQQIAEACSFLGADGILVPSAREVEGMNLVIFCEQDTQIEKEVLQSEGIMTF